MDKGNIVKTICELLLADKKSEGSRFSSENYPVSAYLTYKRQYTKYQMCKVFLRDGFIDRYSGVKLLFPGIIRVLSIEYPEIFRYHKNWKMSESHIIYWEMMPTVDHLVPVARGGVDEESNWVTTSMLRNSAKSNWTLEDLGWSSCEPGSLQEWDGMVQMFLDLTKKNPDYEKTLYIRDWKRALIRAVSDQPHLEYFQL